MTIANHQTDDTKDETDSEAREEATRRYDVVKGLWIEPFAKVNKTSDGKTWVAAWVCLENP